MGLGADLPLWLKLLFQFINFAILAGALVYFLKKPYKDYLRKRHLDVKEKIEEAEKVIKEAGEARSNYEKKIAGLDAELASFKTSIIAEMEQEKKKMLDEARSLAGRIREQAQLAYDQEMKEAMMKIRAEITGRTIEKAETKVRDLFTKEDHERMVEEFIQKMRSAN